MGFELAGKMVQQGVGGLGLPDAGNIVVLTLHRHQRDAAIFDGSTAAPRWLMVPLGRAWRMKTCIDGL